jgi:tetratricopeptide (TPR) repeat protein
MQRTASIFPIIILALTVPLSAHHVKVGTTKLMPVTTASPKARDLYERAMQDYENLYLERANVGWRAAAQADPDFALAYAWIAFNSRDAAESSTARAKAKSLEPKVTSGERLMIEWIANVQENHTIAGIAAMNDMLEMYSKDKRLFFLAANWMMGAKDPEQAERLLLKALALDKNYPAALNDLAYAYARTRQFDKAFPAMERYVALLPTEPNPQDSYAEILRMAGNFDAAIDHYKAALKIDPDFISSQFGLGDTYALKGDQAQARVEYDKAIEHAHNDADRLDYMLQKAMTWVREGKTAEADQAFTSAAQAAEAKHLDLEEEQAYLMMSLYQSDDAVALQNLDLAEQILTRPSAIAQSDREAEKSRVLRYRAVRAIRAGRQDLADLSLHQLETMASGSRNMIIQQSYHGAAGAILMARQKYADAIPHLEEDRDNPCSMELLSKAYAETEAFDKLHEEQAVLRSTNLPTMEQALVVPSVRAQRPMNP